MSCPIVKISCLFAAVAVSSTLAWLSSAVAQDPQPRSELREPVYRETRQQQTPAKPAAQPQPKHRDPAVVPAEAQGAEHPLAPAIRLAKNGLARIDRDVKDYSCTLVKREQIDGVVGEHEYAYVKVRHKPFSVYMYFLGPDKVKGNEAIYVEGRNNGKMVAHAGSGAEAFFGTVKLDPNGRFAMRGQRYPITEMGIRNLAARLIEHGEHDSQFGECDVKWYKGAKINGRVCTCIEVTHPVPRKEFTFNIARIFIDDELQVPVRYEAYEWPKTAGGKPVLQEEYTFMNIKLNQGYTDADFDHRNPNYRYK